MSFLAKVTTSAIIIAIAALTALALACFCKEKNVRPLRGVRLILLKLSLGDALLLIALAGAFLGRGGAKAPNNSPPRSAPMVQQIADDDVSRGFVLAGITTNSQFSIPNHYHPIGRFG